MRPLQVLYAVLDKKRSAGQCKSPRHACLRAARKFFDMKFIRDVWPIRAIKVGRIVMRRMLSFATGRIVHMKLGYRTIER
jgi:hypothetical protein